MKQSLRVSPLRIAHVVPSLGMGGLERMMVDFVNFGSSDGHSFLFVSVDGGGLVADELRARGHAVVDLAKGPGVSVSVLWRLAWLLRHHRVDVVHTHNNSGIIYGAPSARLAGIRRVVHTRHAEPIQEHSASARKAASMLSFAVNYVVCVSEDNARLAQQEGVPRNRLRVVLNGIDLEKFRFCGPKHDGPLICVASLAPRKDVETLLRAMMIVRQAIPHSRLIVVGDGPCASGLNLLAGELFGATRVIDFIGPTRDVFSQLQKASLLVLPSLTEGTALCLMEAMGVGLPIVATAVGGTPEVVTDQVNGLLVPPKSPEALANAIICTLQTPGLAKRFGEAGRRIAEERFDVRRMVSTYESLYGLDSRNVV